MVEMAMFNVQRTVTPIIGKTVLWFMCSAHPLIVLYICVKFHVNISDSIRAMELIFNVQRAITPKVGKPELKLMCSASRLIELYICVKFCENVVQTLVHGYFSISTTYRGLQLQK